MSGKPYSEEEIADRFVPLREIRHGEGHDVCVFLHGDPRRRSRRGKGILEIFDAYDIPWQVIGRESAE